MVEGVTWIKVQVLALSLLSAMTLGEAKLDSDNYNLGNKPLGWCHSLPRSQVGNQSRALEPPRPQPLCGRVQACGQGL